MLSGPELEFMQVHSRNITVVQGPEAQASAAPLASVARKPGWFLVIELVHLFCVLHACCKCSTGAFGLSLHNTSHYQCVQSLVA